MISAQVQDGRGSANALCIDPTGASHTIARPIPPYHDRDPDRHFIFRQYLTTTGLTTGSNDMQVDGSTNNVDFFVQASKSTTEQDYDLYITSLAFVIADTAGALNEFSDTGSALSNGCQLIYQRETGQEVFIHDALQTNFDFIRLAQTPATFATGTNPFRVNNAVSAAEAYIPVVDLRAIFGLPYGIRLTGGTEQKLILRVRDDLTVSGISQFDCIVYGFERMPDE